MEMPRPAAEHKKLERMVGHWTGDETIHPSPMDPVGGKAKARVDNRLALDGFAIVQDYEQERGGAVNFRGHAVVSYDAARKSYRMDWWDSFGFPKTEYAGSFEGDRLELTANTPMGTSRASFDFAKPNAYGFRMEVSMDGGKTWKLFMEGQYTKA